MLQYFKNEQYHMSALVRECRQPIAKDVRTGVKHYVTIQEKVAQLITK